jgi:hypothetical protein
MPGCITNVPTVGIVKIRPASNVLHRAIIMSGAASLMNAWASGVLGLDVVMIFVVDGMSG